MDRLFRQLAGCGLVLLLTAPGCHQGMNRVPPGRSYKSDGQQTPPIDFGSDPKPGSNVNTQSLGVQPGSIPGQAFGAQSNAYTPTNAPRFSPPTDTGAYGPPGTAGTNAPYLSGAGSATSGTSLMPSGAADPRTNPPLTPGAGGAGLGGAAATPGVSSGANGTLPY